MLYSDTLSIYNGNLSPAVERVLSEIKQYFGGAALKVLSFDQWSIVVPGLFKVSLPSNGPVNNIDIRAEEPVLIQIFLEHYPDNCPFILSDRKDFPKANLSHLYYTDENEPARLCLVRGNPNEWFARSKTSDFLEVGNQWFYKAGAGLLVEDGDEFDPTRIEGNVCGKHIYKYDVLQEVVSNNQRLLPDYPMAILVSGISANRFYRSIMSVPFITLPTIRETVHEITFKERQTADHDKAHPLFSILLWHPDNNVEDFYLTKRPSDLSQLKLFFSIRGIDLLEILSALEKNGVLIKSGVPIIYAMRRSKKMIGYNGAYEFLNFVLIIPEDGVAKLQDDSEVYIQGHLEPFSPEIANYISGNPPRSSVLYIGAGSLGSKLIMHDARAGNNKIGVVDDQPLLMHNLARHELLASHVGINKAKAIVDAIRNFYIVDGTENITAYEDSIIRFKPDDMASYRYILDTTASRQVSNYLTLAQLPNGTRYVKAEIAHDGKLGLFYAEGNGRNPRMDDLMYYTCFLATKQRAIYDWRIADSERKKETLNIGLGCSSSTVIMPNDIMSIHAGVFSRAVIKLKNSDTASRGTIIMSSVTDEGFPGPKLNCGYLEMDPLDIFPCRAGSGWNIHMLSGLKERLLKLCAEYAPVETGGVLVGVADYKTKVIHVFDILTEPQDSKGTCVGFTRGVKGLPDEIDEIKRQTGDVIGYVGEWHTHPMNLKRLSQRDLDTIAELKELNAKVPIPTCAVIITTDEILAFIYE